MLLRASQCISNTQFEQHSMVVHSSFIVKCWKRRALAFSDFSVVSDNW